MTDDVGLEPHAYETLGLAIRERRLAQGLTLTTLASQAELSQPFLSQIENGRARPSMMSLYRIAHALGTTPQALFGGVLDDKSGPALVKADQAGRAVVVDGEDAESMCRLLLAGESPFHVLEFVGLPHEFLDYWEHEGFEAVYVVRGDIEVDVAGTLTRMKAGDFLSYPARLPHRLRALKLKPVRVLLMEMKIGSMPGQKVLNHAARKTKRTLSSRTRKTTLPSTTATVKPAMRATKKPAVRSR